MAIAKIKLDPKKAMTEHMQASNAAAVDRFARAAATLERRPTVLTVAEPLQEDDKHTTQAQAQAATLHDPSKFNIALCVPGAVVRVPLHLIDPNPVGPRQIYKSDEIDKIASTLADAQDDAAHGFAKGGRVVLIDGGTRYRSAQVSGVGFLDVKIEEAPADDLELYLRARRYNEQRSQTTVIDHSLSLRRLMERGLVGTNRDLIERVPDMNGRSKMSEGQVSMYLRIAKMPRKVIERMSEHELTSQFTVLYAVSEIFVGGDESAEMIDVAMRIIDEIRDKDMSKKQVIDLVKSRLQGARPRERSTQQALVYGGYKGQIKMFGKRGQIDLTLKGVSEEDLPALQREFQSLIERFAAERGAVGDTTPSNPGSA